LIKTLLSRKKPSIKQGLPVEKKRLLTAAFISVLLFSALGIHLVNLGRANPYIDYKSVSSPVVATITILSPENNSLYGSNNLTLSLDVRIDNSSVWIKLLRVYYKTSWQEANVTVYEWKYYDLYNLDPSNDDPVISEYSCEMNLAGIPEGKQNVTVSAIAEGGYAKNAIAYYFEVYGFKSTTFVVDTTPPTVSVVPIMNETYAEYEVPEIPLNFTVNESASRISYVLDGQENVTIAGNTTLTNLTYGEHNITVYATDNAGNIGISETITFTIAEPEPPSPFPTTMVMVPIASVAFVGAGLLIYFKKRKR
jgi:predicted phage tail protein